ncbi:MAG TPA: GNAT family N-acetyltransferase, partial [Anaerolineae bacterium]
SIRVWVRPLEDGTWLYTTVGCLQPDQWRRGIGRAMLRWGEDRLREIAVDYPKDAPRFFMAFTNDAELGRTTLLRNEGYEPVRYFYNMVRPNLDDVPDAPLPAGVEVRPVGPDQYRSVFAALNEAFRDHWGHTEMTTEEDYQRFINDSECQPELWQVAWDGDQVAGMVLNFISEAHNTKFNRRRGWPDPICVRRPWRKRGLAKALIVRSLHLIKAKGMTEAALGVDTENLSGALKLYESVGFRPASRLTSYRKPLK